MVLELQGQIVGVPCTEYLEACSTQRVCCDRQPVRIRIRNNSGKGMLYAGAVLAHYAPPSQPPTMEIPDVATPYQRHDAARAPRRKCAG